MIYIAAFAGLAAIALAWYLRRTLYFMVLTALGRNRYATVAQMLRVPFHLPNYVRPEHVAREIRVIRKDPEEYVLWDTPLGHLWAPKGAASLEEILAEQMRSAYGVSAQGVQRGDVVLDGGANIGVFSRQAFNLGADKVIAVEPSPENLECLRRNFADELAQNKLIIVSKGLWSTNTSLFFAPNLTHQEAGKIINAPVDLESNNIRTEIQVTTIDTLKKDLGLDRIDFIKLDIEGAEREALAGAAETLHADKPRMAICMYHLDDDIDVLPALIVKTNPAYTIESGMCLSDGSFWQLRPKILFFR